MLGIETSCDETSVAVLKQDGTVRANLIASQIARHQPFGGVVPEIASREHLQHLMPLVEQALNEAKVSMSDLGAVAVTSGPGLIGALLVGVAAAQGLSYGLGIPLVAVNHLAGHAFSGYLQKEGPAVPLPERFISLVVSGGHSSIYEVTKENGGGTNVRMLNRTRDDAAGEIFDKVAKVLGLPYPGGPHIDKLAQNGDRNRFRFPIAQLKDDSADFSFSGLKASAIRLARELGLSGGQGSDPQTLSDFCASFQAAIGEQIIDRLNRLWQRLDDRPAELCFAGGVAANSFLRSRVTEWCQEHGVIARVADRRYCTDNAAMIAFAGLQKGRIEEIAADVTRVKAASRMPLGA